MFYEIFLCSSIGLSGRPAIERPGLDPHTEKKKPSGCTENPAASMGRSIGAFTTLG